MTILDTYERRHRGSADLHRKALEVFPDGVTHDTRRFTPFPLYVERAQGSRKWDVDGNELIDYVSGHGSLLLGHGRAEVIEAAQAQLLRGTHYGASHELEIEWGRWVQKLILSAERVRFTSSGTEAVHMAVRLARAFTRRELLVKFAGNFHGWSDTVNANLAGTEGMPWALGVPQGALGCQVILPQNDVAALEQTLTDHADEVAAVIVEPTGASMGGIPIDPAFLFAARELTQRVGAVLIFDEVVTGFRISPGGAQAHFGITPDMTTMAKILAGGLPGGAVAGREEIMAQINFTDPSGAPRGERVPHPGTFNANPLSASAGIAALRIIADGEPCRRANAAAARLRRVLNRLFEERDVPWVAYGDFSTFHLLTGYDGPRPDSDDFLPYGGALDRLDRPPDPRLRHAFRQAMLLNGVDLPGLGGWLTAAHSDADIDQTVAAVGGALELLREEGLA